MIDPAPARHASPPDKTLGIPSPTHFTHVEGVGDGNVIHLHGALVTELGLNVNLTLSFLPIDCALDVLLHVLSPAIECALLSFITPYRQLSSTDLPSVRVHPNLHVHPSKSRFTNAVPAPSSQCGALVRQGLAVVRRIHMLTHVFFQTLPSHAARSLMVSAGMVVNSAAC